MPEVCIDNIDSRSNLAPGLILIPDISGFTEYLLSSNLQHSQIKIGQLLETILDSNILHLSVSELEGDAVLFYSFHDHSTLTDVIEQCKTMYMHFHQKLNDFSKEDQCQCGNCRMLQKLGLKFIIHYGTIGSLMVNGFCKLYGADVILAHRLLKNNINANEYILFTKPFLNVYQKRKQNDPVNKYLAINSADEFEGFGRISYSYIPMKNIITKKNLTYI